VFLLWSEIDLNGLLMWVRSEFGYHEALLVDVSSLIL